MAAVVVEGGHAVALDAAQLGRLARLIDAWLDVDPAERKAWLGAAMTAHPDLADRLAAMAADGADDGVATRIDPLSFPGFLAEAPSEPGEHRTGDRVGPYRLVSLLGRGGMGTVWLAEQVDGRLSRRVALKLPLPGMAQGDWLRRFERERDILASLDHPGIAKLFDAGIGSDGQRYLAMQHVVGESLTRHAATARLDVVQRVRLFVELLGVVQHAHSALVAHRDLKPGNILVDADGRPMLLDFGIAKLLGDRGAAQAGGATELASPALTLDYAAPEQIAGRAVGAGADLYSLGVVLFELLSGKRPYRLRRDSRAAMEEAILGQEPKPPGARVDEGHARSMGLELRAARRRLRGDLDAIVLKAMRKEPERRYATAQAFAEDLERWLRHEPVGARPDVLGYRVRKLLARHWQAFALGTAIAAALIGATTVALVQARDAREAGESARVKARRAEVVTAFLQDLFLNNSVTQPDPEAARKRTAEQLMDDAAGRIGVALADAPEEQIALLHRMARTSYEMRLVERARTLSRQATDLAARLYGPDDLRARFEEAFWMQISAAAGHGEVFDSRAAALMRSLPALAASPRPEERRLALDLCSALMNRDFENRAEAALPWAGLAESALAREPERVETAEIHHLLGVVYFENLRLADAARHFEATRRLQAARGLAAADEESYPTWRGRLAELTGHYAEAEALMREGNAMERRNDAGGARSNTWGLTVYARFLVDAGRPAEALSLLETDGLPDDATPRAKQSSSTSVLSARARALSRLGRTEEALANAEQADRQLRATFDESLRPPLTSLIEALLVAGRATDALRMLDREEPRLSQGRLSHNARLIAQYRIRALIALGRADEARRYLDGHRSILSPPGGGPAEQARLAWLDSGVTLLDGRHDEARRMVVESLARLDHASPDAAGYLREWHARLQERLGDAALASGDAGAAKAAYETAMANVAPFVDPAVSMTIGRIATQLASIERRLGDEHAARRWQARADAIAARHPAQAGWGA